MKVYDVSLFENSKVIVCRVKARGAAEAKRKAESLCPNAAYLTTTQAELVHYAVGRSGNTYRVDPLCHD